MKKRITALLLTLIMVLSLFPTTVFATGRGTQIGGKETVLSWRANRRSSESGLQVTVTGSGLSGKELSVDVLKDAEAEQYFSAIEGAGNTLVNPMALDIKILDEGAEWQPAGKVEVAITRQGANLSDKVYHFVKLTTAEPIGEGTDSVDAAAAEELTYEELASSTTGETATVDTRHFSVYVISDGDTPADDQPYRATYEFYNSNNTPYSFKNDAGKIQTSQILKNGESLEDVGIPTVGATQNTKFEGWFDEDGHKVEFGVPVSVTENKTIRLTARFKGVVNVFFLSAVMKNAGEGEDARTIVEIKQVEYDTAQTAPIQVVTSDVTTEAPSTEQAVIGWNTVEAQANAGEALPSPITLYTDAGADDIGDVMLFPAISNVCWLYFNENDGGTGGGASYTKPQFVLPGGTPTPPAAPHRTGYTFGGWYTDPECTEEFDFTQPMNGSITVYAKWEGASTHYTVVVWVQKTADSAKLTSASNLPNDQKTYDFYKSYPVDANTGDTATVNDVPEALNLANTLDKDGHIKRNRYDADTTVNGNGTTVLNVYYDRDVMTIKWYNGTGYYASVTDTWYGLYDATFAEANKTWKSGSWQSDEYPISFMDSFKDFDEPSDTVLNLYPDSSSGRYHIYFYKENTTAGQYTQTNSSSATGNTDVTLSEKYTGFKLDSYVRNSSTSYPGNNANWSTATAGNKVNTNSSNLHIRYTRNSYDIEYHNGARGTDGTIVRTESKKYQASLTNQQNPTVTYPVAEDADHYQFIGWFADSSWTTMVTWTPLTEQEKTNYRDWYGVSTFVDIATMPARKVVLYAGYALKGWDCALDPNGGTFTNENQAGVFWMYYGDQFSSDLKTAITREGYIFQGWMVANVPLKDDGSLDLKDVYRDDNNHRFVGDVSNWTVTETPWEFSDIVTGPTALSAKWFYKSAMTVAYDAGEGDGAPTDEGTYSDHTNTVAFSGPTTVPDGKVFIGWDIVGTDTVEKLKPGDTFEVSSAYATDGVVTLQAVYDTGNSGDEEVPATHITWYANNGTDASVTDDGIQTNEAVPIRAADTFTYYGHTFLGWAKSATATENELFLKYEDGKFKAKDSDGNWFVATKVAADENPPIDDLYAIWKQDYFYVYYTGRNQVERIAINGAEMETNGYDLITGHLTANTLYGGYFASYSGASDEAAVKGLPFDENGKTTDANGTAYTGQTGVTWGTAFTQHGNALKPVADTVYYVKEVPDTYLRPYLHYTYYKDDGHISSAWLISNIDDVNYSQAGFLITSDSMDAQICKSLTVRTLHGGNAVKLTSARLFKTTGYLTYAQVINGASITAPFAENAEVRQYWVTPDSMMVTGTILRSYQSVRNKADFANDTNVYQSTVPSTVKPVDGN